MADRKMPIKSDNMEMTALAEILNAANARELPDPRAIKILKRSGAIHRLDIKPRERKPPPSEKTVRDIHIAATVENGLKFTTHDTSVQPYVDASGKTTALSGRRVSDIHKKQMQNNPEEVKKRAWFHQIRYRIQQKYGGRK